MLWRQIIYVGFSTCFRFTLCLGNEPLVGYFFLCLSSPPSLASYACVIFADVVMSFATFAELSGRARKQHVPVLFGMNAISCMKSVIGVNRDKDD